MIAIAAQFAARFLVPALIVLAALGYAYHLGAVHEGEHRDSLELKQQQDAATALADAISAKDVKEAHNRLAVTKAEDFKNEAERTRIDDFSSITTSGLWLPAEACPGDNKHPVPREAPGVKRTDAAPRVRLPAEIEADLARLADDAKKTGILLRQCQLTLEPFVRYDGQP